MTAARLAVDEAKRGGFRGRWAMLTLTYRDDAKWMAQQMTALSQHIRMYALRAGFKARYAWVLELTKRGRPHYHLVIWLPKGRTLPKPDKQGWWSHGLTRIEWARNAVSYIAKYASKGIEDAMWSLIPAGARMHGNGGVSKDGKTELRWWMLPTWVRDVMPLFALVDGEKRISDVRKVPGALSEDERGPVRGIGGYLNRTTGEFLASPYRVLFIGGAIVLLENANV